MTTRLAFIVFGVALALRVGRSFIFLATRTWSSFTTNTISLPRAHEEQRGERHREGELPHRRYIFRQFVSRSQRLRTTRARSLNFLDQGHFICSLCLSRCAARQSACDRVSVSECELAAAASLSPRSFWPNGGWSDDATDGGSSSGAERLETDRAASVASGQCCCVKLFADAPPLVIVHTVGYSNSRYWYTEERRGGGGA